MVGGTMIAWCGAVLSLGVHLRTRDEVFQYVYFGGCALVIGVALTQRRLRARIARERLLVGTAPDDRVEPATSAGASPIT